MANASQHAVYFVPEATNGTTPTSALTWSRLRAIGCTLGLTKGKMMSKELKVNRIQSDTRIGTRQASGEIPCEGLFDAPVKAALEATLGDTWTAPATAAAKTTISATVSTFAFSGNDSPVVVPGDLILVTGFASSTNNGVFQVLSRTAAAITVTSAYTLVVAAAGPAIVVQPMAVLKSGVTRRTFSFLRYFADLAAGSKPYHVYRGCEFKSVQVTIKPEEIVSMNFGILARDGLIQSGLPTGCTLGAASSVKPMDAFAGAVIEGDALGVQTQNGICIEANFTFDNGTAPKYVIGSDTSIQFSQGVANLQGSIKLWFENTTHMDNFLNETETAFIIAVNDPAGNYYAFEFPRVLLTDGQAPVSGDGPLTIDVPLAMQEHATYGSHIRVWKS